MQYLIGCKSKDFFGVGNGLIELKFNQIFLILLSGKFGYSILKKNLLQFKVYPSIPTNTAEREIYF